MIQQYITSERKKNNLKMAQTLFLSLYILYFEVGIANENMQTYSLNI